MRVLIAGLFVSLLGSAVALAAPEVTFHKDVEPILQKSCQECHRPGEIASDAVADLRAGASVGEGNQGGGADGEDAAVAGGSALLVSSPMTGR